MEVMRIKEKLAKKILELKNKYYMFNFYSGFFDELFDASINNLNQNDISNFEFDFIISFKKNLSIYINENFDELKDRCLDIISKNDVGEFVRFCMCLDSLKYDNVELSRYFLENENSLFDNIIKKTLNSNVIKDSNNLSIFMAEYYSNKDEYEIEKFDKLIAEYTSSIDNYDSTGMYLKEIGKHKLLTHEEEIELFKDYKENGNEKARVKIINSNLRLPVSIAKKHLNRAKSMNLVDLAMEGNTGLMIAVDRFDYKKNLKFSTYATWWVYQAITRSIAEKDKTIRQPVHMDDKIKKLQKVAISFEENNGRAPTIEELSDILGEKEEKIKKYYEYFKQHDVISLNQYINDEEKNELSDFIPDSISVEDEAQKNIDKDEIIKLFKYADLNERQVIVISYRYGIMNGRKMSLQEVGDTLGLTRERVRQIEEKSLKKLNNAKKMLDNIEIYNQNLHGIYFLYKDNYYSKIQIDSAIRRMSNLSVKILKKKFGNDYTNNFSSKELSICEEKIFERTINKDIPNAIKHPKYKQDKLLFVLSEIFSEYNFLEVKGAILLLEKDYIKYLYQICGDDLYKQFDLSLMNTDTFSIFNTILQEIKEYLPEKKKIIKQVLNVDNSQTYDAFKNIKVTQGKTNVSKNKSLYKYFEEYSKSEVDDAISRLKNDYYEFLLKIYNNGLDDNYNPNITPSDHTKLTVVKKQLKQLLELKDLSFRKKEEPLITKIFMEYEKDYIIYAINRLDKNQKAFIISVLGNDLENTKTNLSKEDTAKFNSICRNIKKILSKDIDFYTNIYAYFNDYEIDEVNEAIRSLGKINLSILMHNCGKNYLKSFELKKDLESNKEFLHVLDLIRKNINDKKQSQNKINKKTKNKRYKSIYEKYKSCTKEEINRAISKLSKEDIELLKIRYGNDFSTYNNDTNLDEKKIKKISYLVNKKIPNILSKNGNTIKQIKRRYGLYEKLSDYTIDEILDAINKLSDSDIEILKLRYKDNYHTYDDSIKLDSNTIKRLSLIIQKLKRNLKNPKSKSVKQFKTIYEKFSNYSKNEVYDAIMSLNETDKALLQKKYGIDYSTCDMNCILTDKEKYHINYILHYKIKNKLKNPNVKSKSKIIYDRFPNNTKEEIDDAISRLSDANKKIIKIINGDDLENPISCDNITRSQRNKYSMILNRLIPELLANKEKVKLNRNSSREKKLQEKIYYKYNSFTKDEIDLAISKLKQSDLNLLKRGYEDNAILSEKERKRLFVIISKKIKQLLTNPNKVKNRYITIYEKLSKYSSEEIDNAILKLSDEDRNVVRIMNGNDLHNRIVSSAATKKDNQRYYVIINRILPSLIENKDSIKCENVKRKRNIYERYSNYTKEYIDSVLNKLDESDIVLLKIRYGEDFSCFNANVPLTEKEMKRISYLTCTKIKKLLSYENINSIQTIYDRFPNNTKEEVDDAISRLTPANKKIVILMNGSDLSNPVISSSVNASTRNRYSVIINKMLPKLLCDDSDIKIYNKGDKIFQTDVILDEEVFDDKNDDIDLNYINNIINTTSFKKALDGFSKVEKQAIILNITKKYSIDTLSKIFKISTDSIVSITKEALYNFKENIISSFDIIQKKYTKK